MGRDAEKRRVCVSLFCYEATRQVTHLLWLLIPVIPTSTSGLSAANPLAKCSPSLPSTTSRLRSTKGTA